MCCIPVGDGAYLTLTSLIYEHLQIKNEFSAIKNLLLKIQIIIIRAFLPARAVSRAFQGSAFAPFAALSQKLKFRERCAPLQSLTHFTYSDTTSIFYKIQQKHLRINFGCKVVHNKILAFRRIFSHVEFKNFWYIF